MAVLFSSSALRGGGTVVVVGAAWQFCFLQVHCVVVTLLLLWAAYDAPLVVRALRGDDTVVVVGGV